MFVLCEYEGRRPRIADLLPIPPPEAVLNLLTAERAPQGGLREGHQARIPHID